MVTDRDDPSRELSTRLCGCRVARDSVRVPLDMSVRLCSCSLLFFSLPLITHLLIAAR